MDETEAATGSKVDAGVGYLILSSGSWMDILTILAAIFMLCIVGLLLYGTVALLERAGRRWFIGA